MSQNAISDFRDFVLYGEMLKNMASNWQNIQYETVSVEDFPWLDRERLTFYEMEFTMLGFEARGDWSHQNQNADTQGQGFMRLLGNEDEGAYVSLHAVKPPHGEAQPVKCAINCPLNDNWMVAGTDREADAILYQLRLPRTVSLRDCDAAPAELWLETLEIRVAVMGDLPLHSISDASTQSIIDFTQESLRQRARLALQQDPLVFAARHRKLLKQKPPRRELYTGEWQPQTYG